MNPPEDKKSPLSRRTFLAASCSFMAAASAGLAQPVSTNANNPTNAAASEKGAARPERPVPQITVEPFWGEHQNGIMTPAQSYTYFAALDLVSTDRQDLIRMLKKWTKVAANLTKGQPAEAFGNDATIPAPDSGDAIGLSPARLTVTFSFGATLFTKDGQDRYGLAALRPPALVDLPHFAGDQLMESRTGGDLLIQCCSDDPQVAFHAARQLIREAYDVAQVRWVQTGFNPKFAPGETPRNLMGFKDGTNNAATLQPDKFVWVGEEGPEWMKGGSYMVMRRIRVALEHWDRMTLDFQEQTIGRRKYSGAPLSGKGEFDTPDYDKADKDANPVIDDSAHMRLAAPINNEGAQMLRRPFSYNDGANLTAERWPPWRQEMEYDAGLLFICYQRDPRTAFIKVFERMAKMDTLNQFVTHTGGGLFACPCGVSEGGYIGQKLFEQGR